MNPMRLFLFPCILACFVAAIPVARADSDDVTGLIDVAIYSGNNEYLAFTVHRTRIPQLYVMREVLCKVDLVTNGHRVPSLFQLTDVAPHYFAFDSADAVIYFPHRQRVVSSANVSVCLANGVYPQIKVKGGGSKLPSAPYVDIQGLTASATSELGKNPSAVPLLSVRDGFLLSSANAVGPSPGNQLDKSDSAYHEMFSQLVDKSLAEPKVSDVLDRFREQLSIAQPGRPQDTNVRVQVLGAIPNA